MGSSLDVATDPTAVVRTVYEYAYGIDQRDWVLYRSVFADTIRSDFSSYNGRPAATVSGDDWVAGVQPLFTGLDATQHSMTNPLVDFIESDAAPKARCQMYMQAAHFLTDRAEPEYTIGGYYDDVLELLDGRWRITDLTLTVWWRRGDASLMAEAAQRGQQRLDQMRTQPRNDV